MLSDSYIPIDEIPVLLTIFNRPEKTGAVMDNLRRIKPRRLFISADGPRPDRPQDREKCRHARQEATTVDWSCHVETRFLDENKGCDPAVSSAIDWFFHHVEFGIILEDDCIVHPHFFAFCGELFGRYYDDFRMMQISSISPYAAREHLYDYHFSRTFRCGGGWGTWRRAWKFFTSNMESYPDVQALSILKAYHPDHAICLQQYRKFLDFKNGIFNNWDFQWNLACFSQNGLCIVPEKNLMLNIGFGEDSTHTKSVNPVFDNLQVQPLCFPLRHPSFVYADGHPERSLDKKIYRSLRFKSRCVYLLRRVSGAITYLREAMPYR